MGISLIDWCPLTKGEQRNEYPPSADAGPLHQAYLLEYFRQPPVAGLGLGMEDVFRRDAADESSGAADIHFPVGMADINTPRLQVVSMDQGIKNRLPKGGFRKGWDIHMKEACLQGLERIPDVDRLGQSLQGMEQGRFQIHAEIQIHGG